MLIEVLNKYQPQDEFEENDKKLMLKAYQLFKEELFYRFPYFHFTVSAVIFNEDFTKVLFMYHKIYQSYAWVGGHMDGSKNLKENLLKEVLEETGLEKVSFVKDEPISIEILPVFLHKKDNKAVSSHEHYNISYALRASEKDKLINNDAESESLKWLPISHLKTFVSEANMLIIYDKIIRRVLK
ncbi:MAG: NUDIX hydrolase [Acholeplasmatales bacterium]|jgi:8-oxo-dGTP pyrophosphatase MutT (NUDIX family)|nr:NUDIX hydrolase [Acholeplasmataceae bacterium]MDY0115080.1 NUDIX hydrolase [Acholeplasmatales bacterium]MCK9233913.1 NUDIX hydrolase [Acholeplasmataceae bacterium]MCK9289168.1 NUDIX hydrolase [Acholeplasmataceae bacterium]MCK9427068.1 NUDIX hydrolase [Acholeplasmataceae bacterium]